MLNRGISYNYLTNIDIGDDARLHAIVVTVGILQLPVKSHCLSCPGQAAGGRAAQGRADTRLHGPVLWTVSALAGVGRSLDAQECLLI